LLRNNLQQVSEVGMLPTDNSLVAMLDELAELRSAILVELMDKTQAIQAVLSAEQQAQLAAIDAEFDERVSAAQEKAGELEAQVKAAVLAAGASVRGKYLMAVYSRRTSWDNKQLQRLAEAQPEIRMAMKVTSVVSLRALEK